MTDTPTPTPHHRSRLRSRRLWFVLAVCLIALNATVIAGVLRLRDDPVHVAPPISRSNPLADMLGWIPATDESELRFSAWNSENGTAPDAATLKQLDLRPRPVTI